MEDILEAHLLPDFEPHRAVNAPSRRPFRPFFTIFWKSRHIFEKKTDIKKMKNTPGDMCLPHIILEFGPNRTANGVSSFRDTFLSRFPIGFFRKNGIFLKKMAISKK